MLSQQLLKIIWEEVSSRFNCSWLQVLEFRENHVGTPENAAKGLIYHFHQHQYQEQQQQQYAMYHQGTAVDTYGTAARFHQPSAGCMYGQVQALHPVPHVGYYNYSAYTAGPPHAYTLPPQPRYASVVSPQQAIPPTVTYPVPTTVHPSYHHISGLHHQVLKSQELYPTNGHHPHHHYPALVTVTPVPLQNGYSVSTQLPSAPAPVQNFNCPVPTGQLIELDVAAPAQSSNAETQQTYSATESAPSILIPRTVCHHSSSQHQQMATLRKNSERQQDNHRVQSQPRGYNASLQKVESQPLTSGKAKEDGTGTFESWDYVFRNLESQGYSKDLGERPDVLSPSPERMAGNSVSHRNHLEDVRNSRQHHQQQPAVKDLEETLMELRLEEFHKSLPSEHRPLKINEALQKIRMETDSEPCNRVLIGKRSPSIDAVDGSASVYDNMSSPPKDNPERERSVTISTAASKSNANVSATNNKASTRTLPREIRRYGEERDRSSQVGTHYSSSTLDPRHVPDCTNHYQLPTNIADSTSPEKNVAVRESSSKVRIEVRQEITGDTSLDLSHKLSEVSDKNKWECVTCTFLNVPSRDICEMCGKSKMRGPEVRPLASGGRECPQCTLVNEKGVGTCEACGSSLKDSPTYI